MGEIKHLYGAVPSPPDERDYQARDYISLGVRPVEYMPAALCPVHRQLAGDCTAWALAAAKFYHELRERKSRYEFAPVFSFFDRTDDDYTGDGRFMRRVLNNARKNGICYAHDLPEGVPLSAKYPNADISAKLAPLFPKAAENKINSYAFTKDLSEIADCVYQHGSATLTVNVYPSFDMFYYKTRDNWVLPLPKDSEHARGCHEVCAMGIAKEGVVIQNSWSKTWGLNGFAVLPWDYPILEGWTMVDEVKKWDMIELPIKAEYAKVNGKDVPLDVPAQILNGRTMVPIRFIAEALGCEVEWLEKERTVVIRREVK